MTITHLVKTSGGAASAVTDALVVEEYGPEVVQRLFTDTLIEDNDLYRFLIEWCGLMEGVDVGDLLPLALALPQVWEDDAGRKAGLKGLRTQALSRLRRLHWLSDGRHPFDVFFERPYLGNTEVDLCSELLKRNLANAFVESHFDPETVVLYVGIAEAEKHRFEGKKGKPGIRKLMLPWEVRSPLVALPDLTKSAMLGFIRSRGVEPPRLYGQGFSTNNCGGACVKAGHAWWIHLMKVNRPYYLWWEKNEQEFRRRTGKNVAILRDRRGGRTRPMTLLELRELVESCAELAELLVYSDRGCGGSCMMPTLRGKASRKRFQGYAGNLKLL